MTLRVEVSPVFKLVLAGLNLDRFKSPGSLLLRHQMFKLLWWYLGPVDLWHVHMTLLLVMKHALLLG